MFGRNTQPKEIPDGNDVAAIIDRRLSPQRSQAYDLAAALAATYMEVVNSKKDMSYHMRIDGPRVSVSIDMLKLEPRLELTVLEEDAFQKELSSILWERHWTSRFCNGHCQLTAGRHDMPRPYIPQPR